jgi:chromate reductase
MLLAGAAVVAMMRLPFTETVVPAWAGRAISFAAHRRQAEEILAFAERRTGGYGWDGPRIRRASSFGSEGPAMTPLRVGYFVGSLSSTSINRMLAKALIRLAPPELQLSEIPFSTLPLFSPDHEANCPEVVTEFKRAIETSDAVLFVTPEYNRSIPGGLKNALDWASRPYGKNSLSRKPSATIGASPGLIGTAIAQQHLRSLLGYCNSPQMNVPEAYIHFTPGLITPDGEVTQQSTEEFLRNYMKEFHAFIVRVHLALPRNA